MLKTQSFKFSDSDGINEILSKYRLAEGAQILVSNGEVLVPYEDGEEINRHQEKCFYAEFKNKEIYKSLLLKHSQKVNEMELGAAEETLAELDKEETTPGSKESYDKVKDIKNQKKSLEDKISQLKSIIHNNNNELALVNANIEVYTKKISELS